MLVVRVEVWPYGDRTRAQVVGVAHIINDGTGNERTGHYDVRLAQGAGASAWSRFGRVEGFRRGRSRLWELVHAALSSCGLPGDGGVPGADRKEAQR